jgi:hypothetical protein
LVIITSDPKEGTCLDSRSRCRWYPAKRNWIAKTLAEIAGPRLAEHEAAMRDAGITRHAAWHQQTPGGTLALVYMEAPDEAAIARFTGSDESFNTWFREVIKEVHGVDISQPGPPVTKVLDVQL